MSGWKTPEARKQYEATHREQLAEKARRYRVTHREELSAYRKARRLSHMDAERLTHRKTHLKATYGITLDEYDALFVAQEGKCAICGKHSDIMCVDHDHFTGAIRALLCRNCNSVIGMAFEDIDILEVSIEYLNHWRRRGQ